MQTDIFKRFATSLEFATALGRVDVTHNWQTICHPSGEIEWRSQRPGSPDLVVRRRANRQRCDVTIHNERPGKIGNTKKILWKEGLTDRQSFPYLRQVFAALE